MYSDSETRIIEHCQVILHDRSIKNKIVVLCEGEGSILDNRKRKTVKNYKDMERLPDANFYKRCLPKYWREKTPAFFNCQGRTTVIDTYFKLLELHADDIKKPLQEQKSFLSPDKLFAIVDLDLNSQVIDNYHFQSTEEIFLSLYQEARINEANIDHHRIWVTGLIHKEAYFIIPELQERFDEHSNSPTYNGKSLALEDIYIDMADAIVNPTREDDLKTNLSIVSNRVNHCSSLDCSSVENLRDTWKDEFNNALNEAEKSKLIYALLTFKKAKEFWEQIKPPSDWTKSEEVFREELLLHVIGKFYSEQTDYTKYHIPYFLQTLRKLVTNI